MDESVYYSSSVSREQYTRSTGEGKVDVSDMMREHYYNKPWRTTYRLGGIANRKEPYDTHTAAAAPY